MTKEEQIQQMTTWIYWCAPFLSLKEKDAERIAERLYDIGYQNLKEKLNENFIEVVHCKDCKYSNGSFCGYYYNMGIRLCIRPCHYCSYGKREEQQ